MSLERALLHLLPVLAESDTCAKDTKGNNGERGILIVTNLRHNKGMFC